MAFSVKKLENSVVEVTLTEKGEKVSQYRKEIIKEIGKDAELPGFRKGKAPQEAIEKKYESAIKEEIADKILKENYDEILKTGEVRPVDYIKFQKINVMENEVEVVFTVEVYPEFEIGEYKGLEVKKENAEITEENLNNEIEYLVEKNSKLKEVEDGATAEMGDTVNINFEGFFDGEAFEGGKAEYYDLKLGSKSFIDNFEEQIAGHKVNDEFDVEVKFPEGYHKEEYSGKPAIFKIKINNIKRLEKPEINDEFAKDMGYETLEELKIEKKKDLQEELNAKLKNEMVESLLNQVKEKTDMNIPKSMIDREINHRLMELERQLKTQGMNLELYLKMNKLTKEKVYQDLQPIAENKIKIDVILDKIAELENIDVTDEEVETKAKEAAQHYGMEYEQLVEKLKAMGTYDNFMENIKVQEMSMKTIDLIVNSAKVL